MKKKYIKPTLHVECFSLTQNIAGSCGAAHSSTVGGPTWGDVVNCGWKVDAYITYFMEGNNVCTEPIISSANESFSYEQYCYNNPTADQAIFGS